MFSGNFLLIAQKEDSTLRIKAHTLERESRDALTSCIARNATLAHATDTRAPVGATLFLKPFREPAVHLAALRGIPDPPPGRYIRPAFRSG
jgi:hypothetical protein